MIKLIECPRDAMQGIDTFIPTNTKIAYINELLQVGFDTIDFGSFVSPKAIPQMRDTAVVLDGLNLSGSVSKLLAIVANVRGAQDATSFDEIDYLGFPFSVSAIFQQRNTNSSPEEAFKQLAEIQDLCVRKKKKLVVYLSMAFGNPYGESWHPDMVAQWCHRLYRELDVQIMALSDTIGVSNPENINFLFRTLIPALPHVEFGAHLHSTARSAKEKIEATIEAGCTRIDGALKGYGGCPMAADALTGNIPTELVVKYLQENKKDLHLNMEALAIALSYSGNVFT